MKDVPTHVAPPHDMSKVMPPASFSNIFLDVLLSVTIVFRMLTLLSINPRVSIIGSRMRRQQACLRTRFWFSLLFFAGSRRYCDPAWSRLYHDRAHEHVTLTSPTHQLCLTRCFCRFVKEGYPIAQQGFYSFDDFEPRSVRIEFAICRWWMLKKLNIFVDYFDRHYCPECTFFDPIAVPIIIDRCTVVQWRRKQRCSASLTHFLQARPCKDCTSLDKVISHASIFICFCFRS